MGLTLVEFLESVPESVVLHGKESDLGHPLGDHSSVFSAEHVHVSVLVNDPLFDSGGLSHDCLDGSLLHDLLLNDLLDDLGLSGNGLDSSSLDTQTVRHVVSAETSDTALAEVLLGEETLVEVSLLSLLVLSADDSVLSGVSDTSVQVSKLGLRLRFDLLRSGSRGRLGSRVVDDLALDHLGLRS